MQFYTDSYQYSIFTTCAFNEHVWCIILRFHVRPYILWSKVFFFGMNYHLLKFSIFIKVLCIYIWLLDYFSTVYVFTSRGNDRAMTVRARGKFCIPHSMAIVLQTGIFRLRIAAIPYPSPNPNNGNTRMIAYSLTGTLVNMLGKMRISRMQLMSMRSRPVYVPI